MNMKNGDYDIARFRAYFAPLKPSLLAENGYYKIPFNFILNYG